jgi:Iap family predicted aminopeptidase
MFVRLHFLNRYNDSTSSETATWREFHLHEIIDGVTGKYYSVPLEGNAFFERIGNVIHQDDKVVNREFEFAELLFNCLDENVYQYNESMTILPSDQAGSPFTNVVNGMGIVGSRCTRTISFLFDHASLEELCNGVYTKHLKFVDW